MKPPEVSEVKAIVDAHQGIGGILILFRQHPDRRVSFGMTSYVDHPDRAADMARIVNHIHQAFESGTLGDLPAGNSPDRRSPLIFEE